MFENKEMSYDEKYNGVLDLKNLVEDFATRLINQELGKEKLVELRKYGQKRQNRSLWTPLK